MSCKKIEEMKYQDEAAQEYDDFFLSMAGNYEHDRAIEPILKYLTDQDISLDVGCGTGVFSIEISEKCRYVLGLDISRDSIRIAKSRKSANCDFIVGDAEHLPIRDAIFSNVFCTFLLHHIKGQSEHTLHDAINEMGRVLKKNGIFIVAKEPNAINLGNAILFWLVRHTNFLFFRSFPASPYEQPIFRWELENAMKDAHLSKIALFEFGFIPALLNVRSGSILYKLEKLLERIPIIKHFGTSVCAIGRKMKES